MVGIGALKMVVARKSYVTGQQGTTTFTSAKNVANSLLKKK